MKMFVGSGFDQIDRMMIDAAAQKREVVSHPIGNTESQHVAVETSRALYVGHVKCHMAELVRNDAVRPKCLLLRFWRFKHLHDRPLRVFKDDHVADRGLGVLSARCANAVRRSLLLERAEIIVGSDLETDRRAFRYRGAAQDDRVVVNRVGQVDRLLVLAGQRGPRLFASIRFACPDLASRRSRGKSCELESCRMLLLARLF
jgi:hypothetical protein